MVNLIHTFCPKIPLYHLYASDCPFPFQNLSKHPLSSRNTTLTTGKRHVLHTALIHSWSVTFSLERLTILPLTERHKSWMTSQEGNQPNSISLAGPQLNRCAIVNKKIDFYCKKPYNSNLHGFNYLNVDREH